MIKPKAINRKKLVAFVRFSEFSVLYDDYYEVEEEDKKNITKWARSYFSDLREIKSYLEKEPDVKDKVEDWHKE